MHLNDELWMKKFNALKKYHEEYSQLPVANTEYEGHKIACWLRNQKLACKNGTLTEQRKKILDDFCPVWYGNKEDLMEYNRYHIIESDWEEKYVQNGKMSIREFTNDRETLRQLLKKGIYDCETMIEHINHLPIHLSEKDIFYCYAKMIPNIDEYIFAFIYQVFLNNSKNPVSLYKTEDIKKFFYLIPALSKEEYYCKINKLLSLLPDKYADIIRMRCGLLDNHFYTLGEIGDKYNVTREYIRQCLNKKYNQLQKQSGKKILFETNTDLDYLGLSSEAKLFFYKSNIRRVEDIEKYKIKHPQNKYVQECSYRVLFLTHKAIQEIKDITPGKTFEGKKITKDVTDMDLSNRACNALLRSDIYTFKELLEYEPTLTREKAILSIPFIGEKSKQELIDAINDYVDYEDVLLSINKYRFKTHILKEQGIYEYKEFRKRCNTWKSLLFCILPNDNYNKRIFLKKDDFLALL